MSEADFFQAEPTAHASWRWAVLMGANARTYKFAFGDALLDLAASGRDAVTLEELAVPYALGIVRRVGNAPQASERTSLATTDFLTVAREEAAESLREGRPSDRLVQAAVKSIPGMVMDKFHNVRGGELPHAFYSLSGRGRDRMVQLSPELRHIATSPQLASLRDELEARWSIVETSFTTGVGRSVMEDGLAVDLAEWKLTDKRRRRSVAGVKEAVIGFQYGRCMTCGDIIWPKDRVAIDHVFPLALMDRFPVARQWPELNLLPGKTTGVYTIWRNADFLYVGMSTDLQTRLNAHASGRRSGDQFNVYVCDRLVVPALTLEQLRGIGRGELFLDRMTRDYIREHLTYRHVVCRDKAEATALERAVRAGHLPAGQPFLNPLVHPVGSRTRRSDRRSRRVSQP